MLPFVYSKYLTDVKLPKTVVKNRICNHVAKMF